jgi:hypothetical protein
MILNQKKMVAKYYVATRPQTNEHHAVHKEDCPFVPDYEKRIYLGIFNSGQDAVREGQKHFPRTKSCPFCLNGHQQERMKPVFSGIDNTGNIPENSQISLSLKNTLFYFLN